jgi:hypothetical protein
MALTERVVGRWAASYLVAGSGDFMSVARAKGKSDVLGEILQEYFQDTSAYRDEAIALNDAKTAIKYARSKKLTKAKRKGVLGSVKMAGFVVGAATGATVGSVVPGAGTVAGGALGGVGVGAATSAVAFSLDHLKRKGKGFYKILRGTRGEHRKQAAEALLYCAMILDERDPKAQAAQAALHVILDGEFDEVFQATEQAVERIAARLKSN